MSNKLKEKLEEKFFQENPNRMEVANYVNGLLEEKYFPQFNNSLLSIQQAMTLGFMTLQAILVNKGICTEEEIKEFTQEFIKIQAKEAKKNTSSGDLKDTQVK